MNLHSKIFILFTIVIFILYIIIPIKESYASYTSKDVTLLVISMMKGKRHINNKHNIIYKQVNKYPTFIFPGVIGNNITVNKQKEYINRHIVTKDYFTKWSKGKIGCALSHYYLLNYIQTHGEDDQLYIILEDDAIIMENFSEIIDKIVREKSNLPKDWAQIILHNDRKIGYPNKYKDTKKSFVKKCTQCVGTVGYITTKRGAKQILDSILPMKWPIDEDIRFYVDEQYCLENPIIDFDLKLESHVKKH